MFKISYKLLLEYHGFLDTNFETMFSTFNTLLRFLDRLQFMGNDITPIIQVITFFTLLGVAGSKLRDFIKPQSSSTTFDIEAYQQINGTVGKRRKRNIWPLILLLLGATFVGLPLLVRLIQRFVKPTESKKPKRLKAVYEYQAKSEFDLSFQKDDIITLTGRKKSEDWQEGELNGRTGIVPMNYFQAIEENNSITTTEIKK